MSIGLLLITHNHIGRQMIEMAENIFCTQWLNHRDISVSVKDNLEQLLIKVETVIDELEEGDGVLILTDLYGATPGNIACRLLHKKNIRVISGLNLPMLLKIFCRIDSTLDEVTEMAIDGGTRGILICNDDICQIVANAS
jgi:PTS system ascorbate-specific IIA component